MKIYEFFDINKDSVLIDNLTVSQKNLYDAINNDLFFALNKIIQLQTIYEANLKKLIEVSDFPASSKDDLNNVAATYNSLMLSIPNNTDINKKLLAFYNYFNTFIKDLPKPPLPPPPPKPDTGLSTGAKIGIGIFVAIVIVAAIVGIWWYLKNNTDSNEDEYKYDEVRGEWKKGGKSPVKSNRVLLDLPPDGKFLGVRRISPTNSRHLAKKNSPLPDVKILGARRISPTNSRHLAHKSTPPPNNKNVPNG